MVCGPQACRETYREIKKPIESAKTRGQSRAQQAQCGDKAGEQGRGLGEEGGYALQQDRRRSRGPCLAISQALEQRGAQEGVLADAAQLRRAGLRGGVAHVAAARAVPDLHRIEGSGKGVQRLPGAAGAQQTDRSGRQRGDLQPWRAGVGQRCEPRPRLELVTAWGHGRTLASGTAGGERRVSDVGMEARSMRAILRPAVSGAALHIGCRKSVTQ